MSDGRVPTTTTTGEGARSRAAGALASGLDILETLAGSAEGMGVTAIARAAGQDKGNAEFGRRYTCPDFFVRQHQESPSQTTSKGNCRADRRRRVIRLHWQSTKLKKDLRVLSSSRRRSRNG